MLLRNEDPCVKFGSREACPRGQGKVTVCAAAKPGFARWDTDICWLNVASHGARPEEMNRTENANETARSVSARQSTRMYSDST